VDEIIFFRMLNKTSLLRIVDLLTTTLSKRVSDMGIGMELSDEAKLLLAQKGYDPQYGARPLRRTIQSLVEDKFSEALLDQVIEIGDIAQVDAVDGEIVIRKKVIPGKPESGKKDAVMPDEPAAAADTVILQKKEKPKKPVPSDGSKKTGKPTAES